MNDMIAHLYPFLFNIFLRTDQILFSKLYTLYFPMHIFMGFLIFLFLPLLVCLAFDFSVLFLGFLLSFLEDVCSPLLLPFYFQVLLGFFYIHMEQSQNIVLIYFVICLHVHLSVK